MLEEEDSFSPTTAKGTQKNLGGKRQSFDHKEEPQLKRENNLLQ